MKKLLYLSLIIFFSCSEKDSLSDKEHQISNWTKQADNVTIIRDSYGVAHIYGKTDADAVFGLMYAQCEDDFDRVERNYIWAIGRLAEVEGEDALYSDLRARLYMSEEEARKHYEQAPNWLKRLCNAWADGINYFLHANPEVKPALLTRFEPWMTMYFTEGSIGGDIERVSTRRIRSFYEEGKSLAINEKGRGLVEDNPFDEPKGSNGFAIHGSLTQSGNAMLLINPHTSFYFRGEYHMVSEEGLNAYGAITWGQFFIYQGFNEKTGWMHTSTYTDVIDEYLEDITEENGRLVYTYGKEKRAVDTMTVKLKFREDSGMAEKEFKIFRTHHGPVTHMLEDKWVSTAIMWKPVDALTQSYTRTKLNGYQEFREMMNIRTNSSNNTVYADAEGNIAYFHGNFVPKRDTTFDYSRPVDGTNPKTDWNGVHPVDETITLLNPQNGWIQNCNSTPFTAAAGYSPKKEDYPAYMSTSPENFRGVHAIHLLSDTRDFTLDKLIDVAYDPYLPAFEKVLPGLIEAYDNAGKKPRGIKNAIDTLRQWDMKTGVNSVGMTLAHYYGMQLRQNVQVPSEIKGMNRFHYFGIGLSEKDRLAHFEKAVARLNADFGTWNKPWGEICRFQRQDGSIDLTFDDEKPSLPVGLTTARWGALAAYGMRGKHDVKKIYGTRGNSFVAVVEFGDSLKAKSILAGGQSGNPESPHFYDQAEMYSKGVFKDVLFYRDEVEKNAKETYRPGLRN